MSGRTGGRDRRRRDVERFRRSRDNRYDVDAYLRKSVDAALVCYCRVSGAKQRELRMAERLPADHGEAG